MQIVTRKKLESIVDELNVVLGFKDDPIPKETEDQMIHDILEVKGEISPDDPFKKTTLKTIEFLASEPEKFEKIKPKKEEKVKKEKEEKVKPKKEKVKKEKYTRSDAFIEAIKKEGSKKDIINRIDEYYIENGGSSSMNTSESMFTKIMPILIKLNFMILENGKYRKK